MNLQIIGNYSNFDFCLDLNIIRVHRAVAELSAPCDHKGRLWLYHEFLNQMVQQPTYQSIPFDSQSAVQSPPIHETAFMLQLQCYAYKTQLWNESNQRYNNSYNHYHDTKVLVAMSLNRALHCCSIGYCSDGRLDVASWTAQSVDFCGWILGRISR